VRGKAVQSLPGERALLQEPFLSRWLREVEILARLIQARRGTDLPQARDVIYEFPPLEWRDIAGSKLKTRDVIKSPVALARIYRKI
jgi:dolichyl-phosphate beta-glucosyltransferase